MNKDFADTPEVHSDWKLHILPLNTFHSACTHLPLTVTLLSRSSVLLTWAVGLVGLMLCHSADHRTVKHSGVESF